MKSQIHSVCQTCSESSRSHLYHIVQRQIKISSRMSRFIRLEFCLCDDFHVNRSVKSIRIFSPSENDAYENSSRKRDLIVSLKFSSILQSSEVHRRKMFTNLFIIGRYCFTILVLIPLSCEDYGNINIELVLIEFDFCSSITFICPLVQTVLFYLHQRHFLLHTSKVSFQFCIELF